VTSSKLDWRKRLNSLRVLIGYAQYAFGLVLFVDTNFSPLDNPSTRRHFSFRHPDRTRDSRANCSLYHRNQSHLISVTSYEIFLFCMREVADFLHFNLPLAIVRIHIAGTCLPLARSFANLQIPSCLIPLLSRQDQPALPWISFLTGSVTNLTPPLIHTAH